MQALLHRIYMRAQLAWVITVEQLFLVGCSMPVTITKQWIHVILVFLVFLAFGKMRIIRRLDKILTGILVIQWCPDISPGSVQPDNGTIWGVGHKTVPLLHRCIWLK